jgi:hypothetical protein
MESTTPPPVPAPGFYPDPDDEALYRYWDGEHWGEQSVVGAPRVQPLEPPATPIELPDARLRFGPWVIVAVVVAIAAAVLVYVLLGSGSDGSSSNSTFVTSPARPDPPDGAVEFDGDGYTIMVDPTWSVATRGTTRSWYTGGADTRYRDSVGVEMTQARDQSLDEFVNDSIERFSAYFGGTFEVLARRSVRLSSGDDAVRIAAKADFNETFLRFVIIATKDGSWIGTATFAAPVTRFDIEREHVEPYMLTLDVD